MNKNHVILSSLISIAAICFIALQLQQKDLISLSSSNQPIFQYQKEEAKPTFTYHELLTTQNYKATPFGLFHHDCVLELSEGTTLQHIGEMTQLTLKNGEKQFLSACAHQNYKKQDFSQESMEYAAPQPFPSHSWFSEVQNASNSSNSPIKNFSVTQIVPANPQTYTPNALLYFWIGIEPSNAANVLQPVLAFENGEWSFTSWNCCQNGYTWHSASLYGMQPGDKVQGIIQAVDATSNTFETISIFNGQQVSLLSNMSSENWGPMYAYVDIEQYYITSCNQYPVGEIVFQNLNLTLQDGSYAQIDLQKEYTIPSGSLQSSPCDATIVANGASLIFQYNTKQD